MAAHLLGGKVETAPTSEYGKTEVTPNEAGKGSKLFEGVREKSICWMSHGLHRQGTGGLHGHGLHAGLPGRRDGERRAPPHATQFHRVMHTEQGKEMLHNRLQRSASARATGRWTLLFVKKTIAELKAKIGTGKALCALSGGVDSSGRSRAALQGHRQQLTCVCRPRLAAQG